MRKIRIYVLVIQDRLIHVHVYFVGHLWSGYSNNHLSLVSHISAPSGKNLVSHISAPSD